jgi:hypothetical protein
MTEFFERLFVSDSFMPHGHCYLWIPELVWLHGVPDSLIALAYYVLPVLLAYFVRKRRDLPFTCRQKVVRYVMVMPASHWVE